MDTSRRRIAAAIVAVTTGLASLAVAPVARAEAPSVTTVSINGQKVVDGEVRKPVKGRMEATGVAHVPGPPFVADAGDSQFVEIGDPARLAAVVNGGTAPHSIAWSVEGSDAAIADPTAIETTFDTTGAAAGPALATVTVTDADGAVATDTVLLELYRSREFRVISQRYSVGPGVPDELVDGSLNLDGQSHDSAFAVPPGAVSLELELSWETHEPVVGDGGDIVVLNDFDLYVDDPSDVHDDNATGATAAMPERIVISKPAPGSWTARVDAFANTPDTWDLTGTALVVPDDPRPAVSTPGPFRFEVGTPQTLSAEVAGGVAPVTLAWDLDLDGLFDDAEGPLATTAFDLGSHLVAVKATDAAGHEVREITAVRVVTPGSDEGRTPFVVVGVTDSGINLYHEDFRASTYPDERILDATNDFTAHPSTYIDGYPADTRALPITLGDEYLPEQDRSLFTRDNIPLGEMFWVPGTKVIGAIDSSDASAVNSSEDVNPILDEDSHGTRSASVAVGNLYGSCPSCLLVFVEGLSGDELLWDDSWIDITSNSFGTLGNVGDPVLGLFGPPPTRSSAEGGQIQLYAAGNGNENAFITPQQTYTSNTLGPDWTVNVGAVERGTRKPIVGTGKPVDVASWGSGTIPAADIASTTAVGNHSGTSAATPITSGVFADVLRQVRENLDDNGNGWSGGVIASGTALEDSPALADGVLSRAELQEAVLKSAEHDTGANFSIYPPSTPSNPFQYLVEGYGIAEKERTIDKALDVLLGEIPLPDRAAEDEFFAADEQIRDELWGDWNGGVVAGEEAAAAQAGPVRIADVVTGEGAGAVAAAVADLGGALDLLASLLADTPTEGELETVAAMAAGTAETWYLHHTGPCDDSGEGRDHLDQVNSTGDADGCGGAGTAALVGAAVGTWPADDPLARSIPAGSTVNGTIYLQTAEPAAVSLTATLSSGADVVGQGTSTLDVTAGVVDVLTDYWVALPIEFVTDVALAPGDPLTLSVRLDTSASWFFGYEDDHASWFSIDVADADDDEDGDGDPSGLSVAITSPDDGIEIDPTTTPDLSVTGTYGLAPGDPETVRFFTRRDTCGQDADGERLSPDDGGPDSNGCSLVFQALAPTDIVEFRESFPVVAGALPMTLSGDAATGVIHLTGTGISPAHSIRVELVTIEGGLPRVIGSQSVSGVLVDVQGIAPTPFPFSLDIDPALAGVRLDRLSLDVVIETSTGLFGIEHDAPASFVDIPVAGAGEGGRVEVRIDDGAPMDAALGEDGTWGAAFDIAGLAPGEHRIVAVTHQGDAESDPATVTFTVPDGDGTSGGGGDDAVVVEAAIVPEGSGTDRAVWRRVVGTGPGGDVSSWLFSTGTAWRTPGRYDLHVRVVVDGAPTAGDPVTFRVVPFRS